LIRQPRNSTLSSLWVTRVFFSASVNPQPRHHHQRGRVADEVVEVARPPFLTKAPPPPAPAAAEYLPPPAGLPGIQTREAPEADEDALIVVAGKHLRPCQVFVQCVYSDCMSTDVGALRIGEFARRAGVSPELLRAWERRYGLLQPIRSEGGFRLYTAEDAERVHRMRSGLDEGLSAAEAARRALAQARPAEGLLDDLRRRLLTAVRGYDEAALHAVLDEALVGFALETVLRELILPTLREIGEGWERGELEIAQEHFASNLIRERLLGLARLWGRGSGPLAILACAPGERHDIGLIAFGLLLRSHGWRILFLGADTPVETLERTSAANPARLVVVTSVDPRRLEADAKRLRRLAHAAPLVLSGSGASDELCVRLGVERLDGDLVSAAADVAARPPRSR
jgi:DNA-binding transcriptional MerR regulator